jgi:hypothetical protein
MTAGQNYQRAGMWLLLSALFARHAFRDSISPEWMAVSSVLFLVAVIALFIAQVIADRNAKRATRY